ncbi:O-antigen polysaccharide polymerase Wzy [Vibrio cholerae]
MYKILSSLLLLILGMAAFLFNLVTILEILLILIYVIALIKSYRCMGRVNVLFLFLVSFGTFNLSRIFISLVSSYSWSTGYMYVDYSFDVDTQLFVLFVLFCFIGFVNLALDFVVSDNSNYFPIINNNPKLEKVSSWAMLVAFIPLTYRKILEINAMSGLAYSDVYVSTELFIGIPFYLKGWNMLFEFSFYLFLISFPKKKKFIIFSVLFIFIEVLTAINGGRTGLVVGVFLILSVYSYLFRLKLSLRFMSLGVLLILFSQVISSLRSFQSVTGGLVTNINNFFIEQGGSMNVIAFNFINNNRYLTDSHFNIFSPIYDGIMAMLYTSTWQTQSEELVGMSLSLGAQLSFALNQEFYLKGFGIGGNNLAEVYNFAGFFGVAIFAIGVVKVINFCENAKWSRFTLFMFIPFIKALFISPRASVFPNFQDLVTSFMLYMFFQFMILFFFSKKKSVKELV